MYGLKGKLIVRAFADVPRNLKPGVIIYVDPEDTDSKKLTIDFVQYYKNIYRVSFKEISNRTQAEPLVKKQIGIERESLKTLPGNEFYVFDMIGCSVRSQSGDDLGIVDDIIKNPGNDLLKVVLHNKFYFVPMVKEIVLSVNIKDREIAIDPIEGLIDLK